MYHQYYPFFVAFRRAIRSGSGLLYTWSVGMGMDPPRFLVPGDEVRCEIEGIGTLTNTVR